MSEHRVAVYLDIENLCQPYRVEGRLTQGIELMSGFLGALRRTTVVVSALGVCDEEMWRRSTTSAGSCLPRPARS